MFMFISFHSFLTLATDGGGWLTSRPGRFTSGEERRYPTNRWPGEGGEGGQAEHIWTFWKQKSLVSTWNQTPDLHSVAYLQY